MSIKRKLAAIMFTDIAGYTSQMSKDETIAINMINKKDAILKPLIKNHNGTYVKGTGDGSLSYFDSAIDAALCAKNLQASIYDDKDLNVRIGVHLGDTIFEKDGDIKGEGVNIAARLENMAVEGGVFISKEVQDQLINQKEFDGVSLGLQSLKGVGRLIEVYGLKGKKINAPDPSNYEKNKIQKHSKKEVPSLAIIPFKNKGKTKDEFYSYGISVDLISNIASTGIIRVASKKQIEDAGNISQDELAKRLDVRYIVNGDLWRIKNIFQLSIELYDTRNNKVVWADRWQEDWENLSFLKEHLSDGILKALSLKSNQSVLQNQNNKAYELYLKAKYKLNKSLTKITTNESIQILKKSISIDANALDARNLLAYTYFARKKDFYKSEELYKENILVAKKYKLVKEEAQTLFQLGALYNVSQKKDIAIQTMLKSAEKSNSINLLKFAVEAYSYIGNIYRQKKNYKKAINILNKSIKMIKNTNHDREIAFSYLQICGVYSNMREYGTAKKYINKYIEVSKDNNNALVRGYLSKGRLFYRSGNLTKSLNLNSKALKLSESGELTTYSISNISMVLNAISKIYYTKGEYHDALSYIKKNIDLNKSQDMKTAELMNSIRAGLIYKQLKEYDKALNYFNKIISLEDSLLREPEHQSLMINDIKCISLFRKTNIILIFKKIGEKHQIKEILSEYSKIKNILKGRKGIFSHEENDIAELYLTLYQLFNKKTFIKIAFEKLRYQTKVMNPSFKRNFIKYPIPSLIIKEYNEIFK